MNRKNYLFVMLILSGGLFSSCKKADHGSEIKNVTLNVTVASGVAYTLDLSQYGDRDDLASITTQATSYVTSEITTDAASGKYTYTFLQDLLTKTPGDATEKVVLKVYEPAGKPHYDETNITINFTIQ